VKRAARQNLVITRVNAWGSLPQVVRHHQRLQEPTGRWFLLQPLLNELEFTHLGTGRTKQDVKITRI